MADCRDPEVTRKEVESVLKERSLGAIGQFMLKLPHFQDFVKEFPCDRWEIIHYLAWYGEVDILMYRESTDGKLTTLDKEDPFPLLIAIKRGKDSMVKYLIEHCGASANAMDHSGISALTYALLYQDTCSGLKWSMAQDLIDHGADLKYNQEQNLLTLIHSDEWSLVDMLVRRGADLKSLCPQELMQAAANSSVKMLRTLGFKHQISFEYKDDPKGTLLHSAITAGRRDLVKEILDQRWVDVNTRITQKEPKHQKIYHITPLTVALKLNRADIALDLLERGADPARCEGTPLAWAVSGGHQDVVEAIIKKKKKKCTPDLPTTEVVVALATAAYNHAPDMFRLLWDEFTLETHDRRDRQKAVLELDWQKDEITKELFDFVNQSKALCTDIRYDLLLFIIMWNQVDCLSFLLGRGLVVFGDRPVDQQQFFLFVSVLMGDCPELLQLLLDHGLNPDLHTAHVGSDGSGGTLLHWAAGLGRRGVIEWLLRNTPVVSHLDVKEKDSGATALQLAATRGHADIVALLIDHGSNLLVHREGGGLPVLDAAIASGNMATVNTVLNRALDFSEEAFPKSPMIVAAEQKQPRIMEQLWLQGYRVNDTCDLFHGTALHVAVYGQDIESVRVLLKLEASLFSQTAEGLTPLHMAVMKNDLDITRLLIQSWGPANSNNAPWWTPDVDGEIPLHYVARSGDRPMAELLCELCYCRNVQTMDRWLNWKDSSTPLFVAVTTGNIGVVDVMLQHMPEPLFYTEKDSEMGGNSFIGAVHEGKLAIAKLLFNSGADIYAITERRSKRNALHIAAIQGHEKIVGFLLDIEQHEKWPGSPPLFVMGASAVAHYQMIHQKDIYGQQPLHLAALLGHTNIVRLLLNAGADPWIPNNAGCTAYDLALNHGRMGCAILLKTHQEEKGGVGCCAEPHFGGNDSATHLTTGSFTSTTSSTQRLEQGSYPAKTLVRHFGTSQFIRPPQNCLYRTSGWNAWVKPKVGSNLPTVRLPTGPRQSLSSQVSFVKPLMSMLLRR